MDLYKFTNMHIQLFPKWNVFNRRKTETFWLIQRAMSELFECATDNIFLHISHDVAIEKTNKE